jgi:hypothetical protein
MTHDPLCDMATKRETSDFDWCHCPLIAKVRKDQTHRHRGDTWVINDDTIGHISQAMAHLNAAHHNLATWRYVDPT